MKYFQRIFSTRVNTRALLAEFIGMTLFVFTACGIPTLFTAQTQTSPFTAMKGTPSGVDPQLLQLQNGTITAPQPNLISNGGFRLIAALGFGFSVLVLSYAIGHISGAHLNPSVSLALWLSGTEERPGKVHCGILQFLGNAVCQCGGAILGAALLMGVTPFGHDSTLGSNVVSNNVTDGQAFLGEAVMTFFLCFVVLLTVADRSNELAPMAPVAIGLAVFLGNALLIPVDGASINFARSLGPAVVSGTWSTEQYGSTPDSPVYGPGRFWIFFVGPLIGGLISVPAWWVLAHSAWGDTFKEPKSSQEKEVVEQVGAGRAEATIACEALP